MSKVFVLNKWCSSGEKAQVTRTKSDTWKSCSGQVAQVVKAVQAVYMHNTGCSQVDGGVT